jgi:hypothetical protein
MRSRRLSFGAVVIAVAIFVLSPTQFQVDACGPFFEPEVFVRATLPDNLGAFAKGDLGILQPKFDSDEYAVAFRFLNGGKLSDIERKIYAPAPSPSQPVQDWTDLTPQEIAAAREAQRQATMYAQAPGQWLRERATYVPPLPPDQQKVQFPTEYDGTIDFDPNYLNCPNPAFANAVLTLKSRAGSWGAKSPWLVDWIRGQDAVFSNCTGKSAGSPAPVPADSPALLRADRAYQIASTAFYAKQYDEAARQFSAIAADRDSPWQPWGAYLAARATVRKAFALGKPGDPYSGDQANYDPATMEQAQQMLAGLLKQPNPLPSRAILLDELNFIRIRTEPQKRAVELSEALSGPASDPSFYHDLRDLSWILQRNVQVGNPPSLMAWIAAWRGDGTSASAYATWQQTHALPWLVMALFKAAPGDAFAPQLLSEAAKIAPGSPAYPTVFFHRVRLLIGLGRADEARTLLDAELAQARARTPDSYRNALLGERMLVARDFTEFLTYAPRTPQESSSEGAGNLRMQCETKAQAPNTIAPCPELKNPEFDLDSALVLNKLPLSMLIEAANSPHVPPNLRQALSVIAWTRSVLLEDATTALKLVPLLPKEIRDTAGTSVSFPADLAILRNPGIRPYIEAGVPRVSTFSAFDDFRDNWWCKPWADRDPNDPSKPIPVSMPAFLGSDQLGPANAEYARLQKLPDSAALIGQRVVDYAKDHPDDPLIPEALALTVRAGHYACQPYNSGGDGDKSEYTPVSKAAFELLHRRYPKSPWAAKTKYYY